MFVFEQIVLLQLVTLGILHLLSWQCLKELLRSSNSVWVFVCLVCSSRYFQRFMLHALEILDHWSLYQILCLVHWSIWVIDIKITLSSEGLTDKYLIVLYEFYRLVLHYLVWVFPKRISLINVSFTYQNVIFSVWVELIRISMFSLGFED